MSEDDQEVVVLQTPETIKRKRLENIPIISVSSDEEDIEEFENQKKKRKVCHLKNGKNTVSGLKKNLKKSTSKNIDVALNELTNFPSADIVELPGLHSKVLNKRQKNLKHSNDTINPSRSWTFDDVISKHLDVDVQIVKVVQRLLDEKCTIPFIARYRQKQTNNLDVKKIIDIEEEYDILKATDKKANAVITNLSKKNCLTKDLHNSLLNAKDLEEINLLAAPFQANNKNSHAKRAISNGHLDAAMLIINYKNISHLRSSNLPADVDAMQDYQYILADFISKDREMLDLIGEKSKDRSITLSSHKNKNFKLTDSNSKEEKLFEMYFSFNNSIQSVQSHQILAISRGHKQKKIVYEIKIPSSIEQQIVKFAMSKWCNYPSQDCETKTFLTKCIHDSYKRLISPYISRVIWSRLLKKAEKDSIEVFNSNLKSLLMSQPHRKTVLAIDPGFKNGCKVAVTSPDGKILEVDKIYLAGNTFDSKKAKSVLVSLILRHDCETIAIGNGVGCRDVEKFVSDLIRQGEFRPQKVKYCIIREEGVSVYSVSEIAINEMPELDPTLRSAVSLCRRVQDPLAEFVKVDPKHLGIGMYQHDISQKSLEKALNSVVVGCVSFVGVDLNTASELLLTKVSGLSMLHAKNIVNWRNTHGYFSNRNQLKEVKNIGKVTYQQCAGFVRINPKTCDIDAKEFSQSIQKFNPLDKTTIHPESYNVAEEFLELLKAKSEEIGTDSLIKKVDSYLNKTDFQDIVELLGSDNYTVDTIISNFKKPLHDVRSDSDKQIFKDSLVSIDDLLPDYVLTGKVCNVTNFGAFVDIGVGINGLIHISKMNQNTLKLGDRVSVQILSIVKERQRISLRFISFASDG